jgi:diaminopimelate decarboxylase
VSSQLPIVSEHNDVVDPVTALPMTNLLAPDWLHVPIDAIALVPGVWPRAAHRDERGELMLGGVSK